MITEIFKVFRQVAPEEEAISATEKLVEAATAKHAEIQFIRWTVVVIAITLVGIFVRMMFL